MEKAPGNAANPGSRRVLSFGETVFSRFTALAQHHDAINLGQGFPDFAPPDFALAALKDAGAGYQQYAPLPGMPPLLEAVAQKAAAQLSRHLEPGVNVQITVGATEALFAAMQAYLDPGDEAVVIEPFYDAYPAAITMAGGVPRYLPLTPQKDGSWLLDPDELKAAFNPATKLVILNTPHNPTGKVFSAAELDAVIRLAEEHDAIIVSDEVYEHISFYPHLGVAARPGGWERTLTVSSIGKTFSVTGWKIGWAVGPEPLVHALKMAHQWIPYAVATPLQLASAQLLAEAAKGGGAYYHDLQASYSRKRDTLVGALKRTPLKPFEPQGSYFVMADSSALGYEDDVALCTALPAEIGVGAIPPSFFYSKPHKPLAKHLVRFAFCKSDEALSEAAQRLMRLDGPRRRG
jgi:aspartate/methionine/tyrosine aminotransferase